MKTFKTLQNLTDYYSQSKRSAFEGSKATVKKLPCGELRLCVKGINSRPIEKDEKGRFFVAVESV